MAGGETSAAQPASPLAGRRVLVTGATGFLGPHLCRRLAARGALVHAVSRSVAPGEREGVHWSRRDFGEIADVRAALKSIRPELVFHLAGLGQGAPRLDLVIPTFQSNLVTTVNLLTVLAKEEGDARVILASSMEEPGAPTEAASSPYAVAKWAASAYARMFHQLFGVRIVLARIFMAYGPGRQDLRKLLPHVIRSLLQGEAPELSAGERPIDWIFVDDVAEGLVRLAEVEGVEGRTVDVGSGELITVRGMVERVVELMASPLTPRFGTLRDRPLEEARVADTEATFDLLGWRAETPLMLGLQRTIEWYARELEHDSHQS